MRRFLLLLSVLAACVVQVSSQPADKPSFNGTWVLQCQGYSEIYTFQHDAMRLRVIERIDDGLGKRVIDAAGAIDGQPHHLKIDGDDFILRSQPVSITTGAS